jgi:predicted nuclease with TOPRIM domain
MIFAKEAMMKNNNDLKKEIERLKEQIQKTKKEREKLDEANTKLQDEVDSLWAMMDEMTKSDIENWSSILDQLEKDTAIRALMVSPHKADA